MNICKWGEFLRLTGLASDSINPLSSQFQATCAFWDQIADTF